ncbi:taste receptor type 1 member 3 [Protopterus annectens]|uniref:taste receptor type 1 member 3 n=1 Tax=Protopterus annectens TaxID=7888 RepID=UPI001CF96D17|nr:taste receptor type 1 member 3 [Protopterus annectens]
MMFAIDEINNSTSLLPNIKLGYELYDSCSESLVAVQTTLLFLTRNGTNKVPMLCNYTDYNSRVIAVVGPAQSTLALITARLLSFFLIPQISYAASSEKLSDKEDFPSFFRTIPSDKNQSAAMIEIVHHFHWNWVAVIGSDDDYGQQGIQMFASLASDASICIAHQGLIPVQASNTQTVDSKIPDILYNINKSQVNVIVLFSGDQAAMPLIKQFIKSGLDKKIWVGSEGWVSSDLISSIPDVETIGTVIGFVTKGSVMPGFDDYITYTVAQLGLKSNITGMYDAVKRQPFNVYTAVYSIAYALHELLNCTSGVCRQWPKAKPWELLEEVRRVQFSVYNDTFQFDYNGNPNTGYDVITWKWNNGELQLTTIGEYNSELYINQSLIHWYTGSNQAPQSVCSQKCEAGQIMIEKGYHSCCYDCISCMDGYFQNLSDPLDCTACPDSQWSPKKSTVCYDRTLIYTFWGDPAVIGLLIMLSISLILIISVIILFMKKLDSPMVQASGGNMCVLTLFALISLCTSALSFIGRPTDTICKIQQLWFSTSLIVVLSTMLIKSLQLLLSTECQSLPVSYIKWLKGPGTWFIIFFNICIHYAIWGWYFYTGPPQVKEDYSTSPSAIVLYCDINSFVNFCIMFGHNACLAFICFFCSFMVQPPVKTYNMSRGITFSMLGCLLVWTFFIPIFATIQCKLKAAVQMNTIMLCSLIITGLYFLPKCYIILFKPEKNTISYFLQHSMNLRSVNEGATTSSEESHRSNSTMTENQPQ